VIRDIAFIKITAWRNNMFKKLLFLCAMFLVIEVLSADSVHTTIEINGVTVNGGLVYVSVYSNENGFKNETAFA
jgi:uncharacterized protein (DUF2141 family)